MTNQNLIYGGAAGVVGVGVLYFLYSKLPNNDSRTSSVDSDKGANDDYESWTGRIAPAINWGGGKNKKTKHIRNRKGKNSRRK